MEEAPDSVSSHPSVPFPVRQEPNPNFLASDKKALTISMLIWSLYLRLEKRRCRP